MKTREDVLKKRYGFNKGSYDYVPAGAEILKYVGQVVVHVVYQKEESGDWKTEFNPVLLESISEFDPINMTYLAKIKKEKDSESYKFRMIPEGYAWVENEDADFIERILPVSTHRKLVEDEAMYARFSDLYKNRETLPVDSLLGLSTSSDRQTTLRYSRHLAVIGEFFSDHSTFYFRIHDLRLRHKKGKTYALSLTDPDGNIHKLLIESDQVTYQLESVGEFKIIDLEG